MPDQFVVNIPTGTTSRVLDGMATEYQYLVNKKTGETKGQFAERMLRNHLKRITLSSEARAAEVIAGTAVRTNQTDPLVTDPD